MQLEAKKLLHDMRQACERISTFITDQSLESYRRDDLLRSAVERQFQIVGEAIYQLSADYPELAERITEYRKIINFRHVLVHGYDKIEDEVVWGIVQGKLPALRVEIDALLKSDEAV